MTTAGRRRSPQPGRDLDHRVGATDGLAQDHSHLSRLVVVCIGECHSSLVRSAILSNAVSYQGRVCCTSGKSCIARRGHAQHMPKYGIFKGSRPIPADFLGKFC
jgi:hypothetical protein